MPPPWDRFRPSRWTICSCSTPPGWKTHKASKATSVIAVVLGDGLKELFYNAGAELVIDGGPTLNPSTADIVSAIERSGVLQRHHSAQQQEYLSRCSPGREKIAEERHRPENRIRPGGAVRAFGLHGRCDCPRKTSAAWSRPTVDVKSGEMTSACRDVMMGEVRVSAGDSIGIFGGEIRCSSAARTRRSSAWSIDDRCLG